MSTSHVTARMRELLSSPGFLKDKEGGAELRKLYQTRELNLVTRSTLSYELFAFTESLYAFDPHKLVGFASDCFSGDVDSVRTVDTLIASVLSCLISTVLIRLWKTKRLLI